MSAHDSARHDGETANDPDDHRFEVVDAPDARRFELRRDGVLVSFATYREREDAVVVPHVETLREHRGQGYAARLVDGMLTILRAEGRKIVPLCSFAAGHIRDHPKHHDLVAD